jgi:peptidoglycan/xylan/chitin deacetylase (PgdA/CDA1 family)
MLVVSGCNESPVPEPDGRVVVLMYHRITEGAATNLYERSAADFEADLKYLRKNNIRVIGFNDLEEMVRSGVSPAGDCAIITFDDGDHSWYTRAMPLLINYRMGATFFLWTLMIEDQRDSFLSWEEIRLMSNYTDANDVRPFAFGSHTLYHQYLAQKKAAFNDPDAFGLYLDEEFGGSKRLIEEHTSGEVTVLSLPFGDGAGDPDIIAGAMNNGYRFIRTSEWGAIEIGSVDLMRIPSLPILNDTPSDFIGEYLK